MRRPRITPSLVISLIALSVALSGTALAAAPAPAIARSRPVART